MASVRAATTTPLQSAERSPGGFQWWIMSAALSTVMAAVTHGSAPMVRLRSAAYQPHAQDRTRRGRSCDPSDLTGGAGAVQKVGFTAWFFHHRRARVSFS